MRPTWLIQEADFRNPRLQRLLRGGNQQGPRVFSGGKAFENFGPKVITSRVPLNDVALASSTVHVVMTPSSRDLATLDADAEQKLADRFQSMLEMFRLVHYREVAASQYPGFLKFPPSVQDSARALAAPMLGCEDLLEQLATALESQVDTLRFDRFSEPESVVMLAVFSLCHEVNGDLYVGRVASEANRILHDGGETHQHEDRMVGSILNKSLGFFTKRRGKGYRIVLTLDVRRRIHSQAKAMGLNRSDCFPSCNIESGFVDQPCSLCSEFGLMTDHDGRRMRAMSEECAKVCTNCGVLEYPTGAQCSRCGAPRQAKLQDPPSSGA